jgi:tRNA/tmRNA/rRNA uracil-C5-methylase (TrmA/RlmC/RlmD family)
VASLVGDLSGRRFVDAYAGVGLFAGTVGATASHVTAIEAAPSSVADARINLEASVDIHECRVEDWLAAPADVIVADPARSGLGKDAVQNLLRAEPSQIVLVSCDAGSMGRDIGSLSQEGFQLERIEVVDAFADTSHVEVVSSLRR